MPIRQTRVFENEVAGFVTAEGGFFVGQGDLGAKVHAGQNLHCPTSFRHESGPLGP